MQSLNSVQDSREHTIKATRSELIKCGSAQECGNAQEAPRLKHWALSAGETKAVQVNVT